jgi:hypothetical protein
MYDLTCRRERGLNNNPPPLDGRCLIAEDRNREIGRTNKVAGHTDFRYKQWGGVCTKGKGIEGETKALTPPAQRLLALG